LKGYLINASYYFKSQLLKFQAKTSKFYSLYLTAVYAPSVAVA